MSTNKVFSDESTMHNLRKFYEKSKSIKNRTVNIKKAYIIKKQGFKKYIQRN